MFQNLRNQVALLWVIVTAVGAAAQTPATPPAVAVWRPVWFIEGPLASQVPPDWSNNELRLQGNQLVLALADGQVWSRPIQSLQSIKYFRQFERQPAIVGTGDAWVPNPGAIYRSTNHFVDLEFSDEGKPSLVMTLQLDKTVYQPALATLQQLTAKPVLASPADGKTLPKTLKVEQASFKREPSPRVPAIGPSVAYRLAADAQGKILGAVLMDGTLQVWDIETGLAKRRLQVAEASRVAWNLAALMAFRPGSAVIAVSTARAGIEQWDIESGVRRDAVIPTTYKSSPLRFWFTPDGTKLIAGFGPGGFACWDSDTAASLNCLDDYHASLGATAVGLVPQSGVAAAFSADGTQLALATFLNKTRTPRVFTVLEWPEGRVGKQLREGGDHIGSEIRFTAKDQLIERYTTGHFQVWRLAGASLTRLWNQTPPSAHDEFDVSEQLIAAGGWNPQLLLYSTETKRVEAPLKIDSWVSAVAFIPGGRLAVGTVGGTVQIWDLSERRMIRVLTTTP